MSVTGTVTVPSLLHKVRQIQPALRACAADAERDRRLPDAVFQAMHEQGLYRLWKPKLFGGLEADPITAFQVFEEVSRIDSAAGWNLQLSCGAEMFGAWFSDETIRRQLDRLEFRLRLWPGARCALGRGPGEGAGKGGAKRAAVGGGRPASHGARTTTGPF